MNDTEFSNTPLHEAIDRRDLKKAKLLLESRAVDLNVRNALGYSALHIAAKFGDLFIVRTLVERHAAVDALTGDGSSPLFLAAWKGQREIVEFLAFKGADIHRIDDDGWSLMFTAAFHGQVAVIEALAALDCSIEAPTSSPTPLLTAIRGNHVEAVQLLLELNANTANAEAETYHDEILQMLDDQAKKSEKERLRIRNETLFRIRNELGIRLMRYAHDDIVDVCIALAPLRLPPFVLLCIIDELPGFRQLSPYHKMTLIESIVNDSFRKLRASQ